MGFTIEDYDLRTSFRTDKKMLLFAGFYPRRTTKKKYLFHLAALINIFFSSGQILTMTIEMIIDRKDISKLSETLQYFITVATYICKLINFIIYRKTLLEIEDSLTITNFYGFCDNHLQLLKHKINSCRAIGITYRAFCFMACSLYAIAPYFDKRKPRPLPYPAWFPFSVTTHYYWAYIFQAVGAFNTAYTNSAIDILTWTLITVATGQFNILKLNLQNIFWGEKNSEKNKEEFKRCVKHHEEIVKLVYKIESMFSKGIFLQFVASVIIICFTGFSMITVPIQSMQFCFLFIYFCCMMCQVGMYCWYGHDVMTTSDTITEFFYMSNWYESDLTVRKSVFIFLERAKKPVTLTAGGFVTLSLTTLTSILRSAYSYFAVLRHMYVK